MTAWMAWGVLGLAVATLLPLLALALHRTHLLGLSRSLHPSRRAWTGPLPTVTVQLPVYNESTVVRRLIDAAALLDYPRHLLEIQVLDDSTDATSDLASERVRQWRAQGLDIRHMRRHSRVGFKAGALAAGLASARGEFILILDADFVPAPDLVRRLLDPMDDPGVGMVQARWGYQNEDRSLLTRCQALLLDAHFLLEHAGRAAGCRFFNFNGTAGMWRRAALEDAGGWSSDTLTEDLDVSYRAQMAGWRFEFLPEVAVPSELPETVGALETQQKRWSQGGIQTARKLLPDLLTGSWRADVKGEATVHLLGHLAHPFTMLLGLLILPSAFARRALGLEVLLPVDLVVLALATCSFLVYFVSAGRRRGQPWGSLAFTALPTLALGIGLGATVTRAVLRGLGGAGSETRSIGPRSGERERFGTMPARCPAICSPRGR